MEKEYQKCIFDGMSLYKQIVELGSQRDCDNFQKASLIAEELYEMMETYSSSNLLSTIYGLQYIAYCYDAESELINQYSERIQLKNVAARKAGFDVTSDRVIKIVLNKDEKFNNIIGFYLRHTQPLEWQAIINLEDVLDEMFSMIRPRKDYDSKDGTIMTYDLFMNAVTAKGNAALKAVSVMEKLIELKNEYNTKDKNIHKDGFKEIGEPEREKRPEDILRERSKKQTE